MINAETLALTAQKVRYAADDFTKSDEVIPRHGVPTIQMDILLAIKALNDALIAIQDRQEG